MQGKDTCLLVIDMQNDFLNESSPLFVKESPLIIPNLKGAIEYFRQREFPVIYVRRLHRKDGCDVDKARIDLFNRTNGFLLEGSYGSEIVTDLSPEPRDLIITKKRFSAFFSTELDLILRRIGIKKIVIGGVQTPNCIRATAVDAISLDYDVFVLSDGTASNSKEIQEANLSDMKNLGICVISVKELKELFKE